ncbi:transcriptional regulator [Kosakonia radicincitans]|nr:transcriptional regulator [Kosakonia radicincitans]
MPAHSAKNSCLPHCLFDNAWCHIDCKYHSHNDSNFFSKIIKNDKNQ